MIRRMTALLLFAVILSLFAGCGTEPENKDTKAVEVYYVTELNGAGNIDPIRAETHQIPEGLSIAEMAKTIVTLLLDGPQSLELSNSFPAGTRVLSCNVEAGHALVNLSEQYGELSGMDLTIADYCITLSLCQLDGIETVSVTVNGKPLPYRDRQVFSAEDVLLSSRIEAPQTVEGTLYFVDSSDLLKAEVRTLEVLEGETAAEKIIDALLEGPESDELQAVIPKGTKLLSISTADGLCEVSFSREFSENMPEDWQTQQLVIYSVINSLTYVESLSQVQILIEGEIADYYGSVPIGIPLTYNEWISRSSAD